MNEITEIRNFQENHEKIHHNLSAGRFRCIYRGVYNAGRCLFRMGKDVCRMFLVPYGLGYMCFGSFRRGLVYVIRGASAPGMLILHTLMLPLSLIGLDVNI